MHEAAADAELRELMQRYQAGEMDAFERLYAALAPALLAYLRCLTREASRAQDLLQEAFLQIHRSRHVYRRELPVRPWVYAIARNVWLMDQRTRSRRPAASDELPDLPVPPEADSLGDRQAVRSALGRMLPDRREALLLHHVWGFSFREIGQMLGIRADAAKIRSSRGMADLRKLLGAR